MTDPFDFSDWATTLAAIAFLVVGVGLLRSRWLGAKSIPAFVGWLSICAGFVVWSRAVGAELATVYALLGLSLAGYLAVAATLERRSARARDFASLAAEPEVRRVNWKRAAGKSFLAIVLAGIAAFGMGVAFAVAMPLAIHDRILLGGLLVPLLWGAGMAWTLADAKTLRATVLLTAVAAASYGIAFLPRLLAS